MRSATLGKIGPGVFLFIVAVVSLGVRVWGIGFGLPEYTRYHPDEHALVERAAEILWTGDWNLHRFNYPPLYAYFQAAAYALYFLYGVTQELWQYVPTFVVPNYYLVGRLVTAIFGTLAVLVVYLTGRQLWGRRSGLLAVALLGTSYLHVIHSHYATFDIMVGFWVLLALLFSDLIRTESSAKWYFLAGLCAGFAGATKYNGAIAVILPLLAHILVTPWGEWGWLNGRLFLACGAFLVGLFGGNPFALGNLPDFLSGLATVLHHYGTEHPGFEGTGNWRWYPSVFLRSADSPAVVAGVIGLFGVLWRNWRKGLLVLAFPVLYYLMVARFVVRFERNMVPLLPFLALGCGWLLDAGAEWLARTLGRKPDFSHILAALGAVVLISLPLAASVSFDHALSQTDHREIAGRWVEENIDRETKIAIEHYSIPFDYAQYQVEDVLRVSDHSLEWYQQQGFAVVIVSDGVWEILRRQPEFYGERLAVYDDLAARASLLAEFVPEPSRIVVAGYPTVEVYHFAPVRIYDVSR